MLRAAFKWSYTTGQVLTSEPIDLRYRIHIIMPDPVPFPDRSGSCPLLLYYILWPVKDHMLCLDVHVPGGLRGEQVRVQGDHAQQQR